MSRAFGAAAAALTLGSVAATASVPFLAWSSAPVGSATAAHRVVEGAFARNDALAFLSLAAEGATTIGVFVFDELAADDAPAVVHRLLDAPGSRAGRSLADAPATLSVARADLRGAAPLVDDVASTLAAAGCTVVRGGAGAEGGNAARVDLLARLDAAAVGSCTAYVLPLAAGSRGDADFLDAVAAGGAPAGFVGVVTAAGAGGGARRRVAAAATPTPRIYMVPEVTTGLLVSLLLLIALGVGLSCLASIKAPDVMHSTTLLAGKEY